MTRIRAIVTYSGQRLGDEHERITKRLRLPAATRLNQNRICLSHNQATRSLVDEAAEFTAAELARILGATVTVERVQETCI